MECQVEKRNNKTVIHLQGRLDAATVPILENTCLRSLDDEAQVVFDMTHLDFISSAGVRILIPIMKRRMCGGEKLVVCGLNEQVHELMKVTRLDEFLSIHSNLEDALA